jgi:hypothetical protein
MYQLKDDINISQVKFSRVEKDVYNGFYDCDKSHGDAFA